MKKQVLLVALLACLPYLGVLESPFVFDDVKLVRDNPSIRDLSAVPATFNIFSSRWDDQELRANYRPLRFLSYAIDYQITRWIHGDFPPQNLSPAVFHLHNVLLHALNAVLLLFLGRFLLGDGLAALALALLFALHPVATEAVTYVSGRRDVLSTFFFLAALLAYLKGSHWPSGVLVAFLFILGLLSKEMVVTLPAVILLIDLARRAPLDARRVAVTSGLFAIAAGFTALEVLNPRLVAGALGGSAERALWTAPRYVGRYLGLCLFPWSQSIDYSFDAIPVSSGPFEPWATFPLLFLCAALAGAGLWALWRAKFVAAVGLLWFLGTLLPVLQLVPIPERFAERFVYLPSIGLYLLAAAAFRRFHAREGAAALGVACAVLAAAALGTVLRNRDWASDVDLWGSAARAQPRAARAHLGHGHALRDLGRCREAVQAYTRVLSILGEAPPEAIAVGDPARARGDQLLRWGQILQARTFRAQCHGELGKESPEQYRKAIEDYRWLLAQKDIDGADIDASPRHLVIHYDLGSCLLGLSGAETSSDRAREERASAAGEFERVARAESQPSLARAARYYRGKIALAEGRADDGLREMEEAYRLAREGGDAMDRYRLVGELTDMLIARKDLDRAAAMLSASLAELAGRPERKHLLYRLARIHDRKGDAAGAAHLLEDALAIDPGYGPALLTLAALEETRGKLERAEELYRRLLAEAPGEPRAIRGLKGLQIRRDLARDQGKAPAGSAREESDRIVLEGLIARGEGHLQRGELLAAVEPFRRAALGSRAGEGSPRERGLRSLALRRLGKIARDLGKLRDAENYLAAAISTDPEDREALKDLGDLQLRDLNERDAAARSYQEFLDSLAPGERAEPRIYLNLAKLVQEKEPARAAELYLTARGQGVKNPAFNRNLGYLLASLGRWEDALQCLEDYLDQDETESGGGTAADAAERERAREYLQKEVLPRVKGGEVLSPSPGKPR